MNEFDITKQNKIIMLIVTNERIVFFLRGCKDVCNRGCVSASVCISERVIRGYVYTRVYYRRGQGGRFCQTIRTPATPHLTVTIQWGGGGGGRGGSRVTEGFPLGTIGVQNFHHKWSQNILACRCIRARVTV